MENLFAVTEEVKETQDETKKENEQDKESIYNKATDADKKYLADLLVSVVNMFFNLVVLDLLIQLPKEEIDKLKITNDEKEMLNKAYLRFVKYYNLADKLSPLTTLLIANLVVYGKVLKNAIKAKKALKEKEQKQIEKQAKIGKETVQDLLDEIKAGQKIQVKETRESKKRYDQSQTEQEAEIINIQPINKQTSTSNKTKNNGKNKSK